MSALQTRKQNMLRPWQWEVPDPSKNRAKCKETGEK